MTIYKKTHLRLVDPPPAQETADQIETYPATFQIRIFPFSMHIVVVYFRFARRITGRAPEPWGITIESMNGPQVLGIDLDNTLTRQKGMMLTYRQHIQNCVEELVYNSLGGAYHIFREHRGKSGIIDCRECSLLKKIK